MAVSAEVEREGGDPGEGDRAGDAFEQASGQAKSRGVAEAAEGEFSRDRSPASPASHPDRLTVRERETLGWVGSGRSNDEIAAELVVSPTTVRTQVGHAMTKLNARDRAQLVIFAIRSGLPIPN